MPSLRIALPALLALTLAACSDDTEFTEPGGMEAGVRVVNATQSPMDVLLDGRVAVSGLGIAGLSPSLVVAPGTREVQLRSATGATTTLAVSAIAGRTITTVVYPDTAARIAAQVLQDTGAVVPAGKSKLRVTHLAANAGAIDVWRTQPDWQTPTRVMFPFRYMATSSYLQSDPGTWEVWITPEGGTAKLATTGAIDVPSGQRRTVVVLDSAGVTKLRVIEE